MKRGRVRSSKPKESPYADLVGCKIFEPKIKAYQSSKPKGSPLKFKQDLGGFFMPASYYSSNSGSLSVKTQSLINRLNKILDDERHKDTPSLDEGSEDMSLPNITPPSSAKMSEDFKSDFVFKKVAFQAKSGRSERSPKKLVAAASQHKIYSRPESSSGANTSSMYPPIKKAKLSQEILKPLHLVQKSSSSCGLNQLESVESTQDTDKSKKLEANPRKYRTGARKIYRASFAESKPQTERRTPDFKSALEPNSPVFYPKTTEASSINLPPAQSQRSQETVPRIELITLESVRPQTQPQPPSTDIITDPPRPRKNLPMNVTTSKANKFREEQVDKLLRNKTTYDLKSLMAEYLKRLGLPEDTKVFAFSGQDEHIRQTLKERGWVENRTAGSNAFHLKWVYTDNESDYKTLLPGQKFNHFPNNREITTKSGLCQNLNSVSSVDIRVETFFPRCFDLGEAKQVKAFIKDYERSALIGIVKQALYSKQGSTREVRQALRYADFIVSQAEDMCELRTQYSFVPDFRSEFSYSRDEVQKLLAYRPSSEILPLDILQNCEAICRRAAVAYPQSEVDGTSNIWILKPGQNARGSGIRCFRDLQEVLNSGTQVQARVIQKYIERPYLLDIEGKMYKFDIRQWVLVTSWEPLELYSFDSSYLRICQEAFDLDDIENLYRHLTNYSIQKSIAKAQDATVWSSKQFSDYLTARGARPWEDVSLDIHAVILDTVEALSEAVNSKETCFEMYGFDILLDESLKPWLLEVNLSPACSARAPWLAEMLKRMADGMLKIVLKEEEQTQLYSAKRQLVAEPHFNTNSWQMLYRSSEPTSPEIAIALEVVGRPANIRVERKLDRTYLTEQAARLLQRYGRGFLVRTRNRHEKDRKAATLIQAHIRRVLAQAELVRLRRTRAAIKLQAAYRAYRARNLLVHLKKERLAIKLQSLYRGRKARRHFKELRLAHCALTIQKTFRRLAGYTARGDCMVYHAKIRLIQRSWKVRWALKTKAVTAIQSKYRGLLAERLLVKKRIERQAAIKLQCCIRGFLAKAELTRLKRLKAAIKLQSFARMMKAKSQLRNLIETRAALVIQTHYRSFRSKQIRDALSKLKAWRVNAARNIQRVIRGHIDRVKVAKRMRTAAATLIQTEFRWYLANKRYMQFQFLNKAAIKIQAIVRGRQARKKVKMLMSINKLKADRLRRKAQRGGFQEKVQSVVDRLAYRIQPSMPRPPSLKSAKEIIHSNRRY